KMTERSPQRSGLNSWMRRTGMLPGEPGLSRPSTSFSALPVLEDMDPRIKSSRGDCIVSQPACVDDAPGHTARRDDADWLCRHRDDGDADRVVPGCGRA